MRLVRNGAQRASSRSGHRRRNVLAALLVTLGALSAIPPAASAATMKVVIVVGPVESMTGSYVYDARVLANQARSYGASVTEIYSPYATWSRVRAAAQGANLFIYLGHGNGWPSPYAPYSATTKDGVGLNATSGAGNSNNKYYGEYYLTHYIRLAPDAVVILNHLCYSAGNSESWQPNPTRTVARQRIVHPVFAVQDEPDDAPDLLELTSGDPQLCLVVHLEPDERHDRDLRSVCAQPLLPVGDRQAGHDRGDLALSRAFSPP